MTEPFAEALRRLMTRRGIGTKSEAIRIAVQEAADRADADALEPIDFTAIWEEGRRLPRNPSPRFASDDDLWER